jgi:hypothetical protein
MRDIERQVGDLKDQVFRAKARLSLLSEKFLRTSPGGGRAVLLHKNQLGRLFQPLRITYQLDGREIYSSGKDGSPLPTAEQPVWDGGLKPGDHTLSVALVYRGNGTPALSYFSQYTYTATAAHRFTASDGGVTRIRVVCREQGNAALTEVADRPLIEFQTEDSGAAPPASPTATATAAPAAAPVKAEDKPLGNR